MKPPLPPHKNPNAHCRRRLSSPVQSGVLNPLNPSWVTWCIMDLFQFELKGEWFNNNTTPPGLTHWIRSTHHWQRSVHLIWFNLSEGSHYLVGAMPDDEVLTAIFETSLSKLTRGGISDTLRPMPLKSTLFPPQHTQRGTLWLSKPRCLDFGKQTPTEIFCLQSRCSGPSRQRGSIPA